MTLGFLDETKTAENLERHAECVVNVPPPYMWRQVEKLAPLTGKDPVPDLKADQFHTERDKFGAAGLTPEISELVGPDRVVECPVQMEARVLGCERLGGAKLDKLGGGLSIRIEILRVHMDEALIKGDRHIDPAVWSPLIYNFVTTTAWAIANSARRSGPKRKPTIRIAPSRLFQTT